MPRLAALVAGGAAVASAAWVAVAPEHSGLPLLIAAMGLIITGAAWLETGSDASKEIVLVATLAAVAAAGRVLFAAVPGVQPVTVIAVAAGAALGARAGFATGALAALASNFFLGQGPWTPWQMLGWGACGLAGAALAPVLRGRGPVRRGLLRARLRVQRDDGHLVLGRLLAAHLAGVHGRPRPGRLVRGGARDRERRHRSRDRA